MTTDSLGASKKAFHERGSFWPFYYAIGLEASLSEAEHAMLAYPLEQPTSDEQLMQFFRALTLYHECAHFSQFVSSAYGLRTLRYTLICLRNLMRKRGWTLPIANNLLSRIQHLSDDEMRTYEGCLIFLDGMDQLTIHKWSDPLSRAQATVVSIEMRLWSPHFFQVEQSDGPQAELAAHLIAAGGHLRKLPILSIVGPQGTHRIVLNAAVLMEGFAIACELNHLCQGLGCSIAEALEYVPKKPEYLGVIYYLLQSGFVSPDALIPVLAVFVDVALMYDPFILYDVPWDARDANGRGDQYPGETFLALCNELKNIALPRSGELEDVARFHKDACRAAGLPDPVWMAETALGVAQRLVMKSPSDDAILMRALKAHRDGLKYRCSVGSAFPFLLLTTQHLNHVMELSLPSAVFYNLHTRQADRFDPKTIDVVTIHAILQQAITGPSLQCPLKTGVPFFCESAGQPENQLCVWKNDQGQIAECLVDVLERQFGFGKTNPG